MPELGWNIEMGDRKLEDGAISEGSVRNYVKSYDEKRTDYKTAFIEMYNKFLLVKKKQNVGNELPSLCDRVYPAKNPLQSGKLRKTIQYIGLGILGSNKKYLHPVEGCK
jgi:hypothetical protein